jgi:hypothetical protein
MDHHQVVLAAHRITHYGSLHPYIFYADAFVAEGVNGKRISKNPAGGIGRFYIASQGVAQSFIFFYQLFIGFFEPEIIRYAIVFFIDLSGYFIGYAHKNAFVKAVVAEECIEADTLEQQEEEQIRVFSDEEKYIGHVASGSGAVCKMGKRFIVS